MSFVETHSFGYEILDAGPEMLPCSVGMKTKARRTRCLNASIVINASPQEETTP